MGLSVPNVVIVAARDAEGNVVAELTISSFQWYESLHALIDEAEERRRLSVRSIDGYQTDGTGRVYERWRNVYDAAGVLIDSRELDPSDASNQPGAGGP